MTRKIIYSSDAPEPVGPYNHAVSDGRFAFTAGQIPLDPDAGQIVEGNFQDRVEQVFRNLDAVHEAGSTELFSILKMTVFFTDLPCFSTVNKVFSDQFKRIEPPARSVVEVSGLPMNADIEIECIASV
jgi:2-iminobutanoate/2-iminopropanoate deaminase